jgi:hypothetical protein
MGRREKRRKGEREKGRRDERKSLIFELFMA